MHSRLFPLTSATPLPYVNPSCPHLSVVQGLMSWALPPDTFEKAHALILTLSRDSWMWCRAVGSSTIVAWDRRGAGFQLLDKLGESNYKCQEQKLLLKNYKGHGLSTTHLWEFIYLVTGDLTRDGLGHYVLAPLCLIHSMLICMSHLAPCSTVQSMLLHFEHTSASSG